MKNNNFNQFEQSLLDLAAISILPEVYMKNESSRDPFYSSSFQEMASKAYALASALVLERRKIIDAPASSV